MPINKQSLRKFLILFTLSISLFTASLVQAHIQAPAGKVGIMGGISISADQGSGLNLQGVYGVQDTLEIGGAWGTTPGNLDYYVADSMAGAFINWKFFESETVALKTGISWYAFQNSDYTSFMSSSVNNHTGSTAQLGAYFKTSPGITPFVIQSLTGIDGGSGISQTQLGIIFGVTNSLDIILSTARDAQGNGDAQLVLLKVGYYFL